MSITKFTAPWSLQQVVELNIQQSMDDRHGYTCGNAGGGHRPLIATQSGWVCPDCDYKQNWFHAVVHADAAFIVGSGTKN